MHIRAFEPGDTESVVLLWQRCGLVRPQNDPLRDIQRKLKVRPDLFLVGVLDGKIIASVMAGYDGHRGWLNYVGVDPDYQRRDFGRAIIAEAERLLRACGCPKINLQVRHTNREAMEFYRSIGYLVEEVASMGKRLEHDEKTS